MDIVITYFSNKDAVIGFENTMYSTTETSLSTEICILSSDNLGREVTVNIKLVDGSAQSEWYFYSIFNNIMFDFLYFR